MALGDFNNDGRQDLAIACNDGKVWVRLGDGAGGFAAQAPSSPITVNDVPEYVAAGDFNNDGNEDLAVSRRTGPAVTILMNNGAGTFTAGSPTLAVGGGSPSGLAVGDLNSDGFEDLVVANSTNNAVLIKIGDGTTQFGGASPSSPITGVGPSPERVGIGDFNNDGRPDLLILAANSPAVVHIKLATASGAYATAPGSPIEGALGSSSLRLGDFNRDGNEDFAAIGAGAASQQLLVALGDGTGGFTRSRITSPDANSALALGDFNSDGLEDLATTNGTTQKLSLLLGDGLGAFPGTPPGAAADVGGGGPDAVVGDFNADGNEDIALDNQGTQSIKILLGGGTPRDAGNLLVNGGAEASAGSTASRTFGVQTAIPGWAATGPFSNHRYVAADGYPDRLDAARWEGQEAFFAIGATTGQSSATQTVSVGSQAALIDAGNATATLRGYLGGYRVGADSMQATATFKNAAGVAIGAPIQIGPVMPADRKNRTTMLPRSANGPVPAGTRVVTVTLTATHGSSIFQDTAYADRMALFINDASAPPGGGDPPGGSGADTTPPETTITTAPKNKSSKAKAKYKYVSSEAGSTFQCKFDRKPFKPCDAGKIKYKRLDYGKHKFQVVATDAAGNADASPAKDKFKRK
jgi:hypothetical protein